MTNCTAESFLKLYLMSPIHLDIPMRAESNNQIHMTPHTAAQHHLMSEELYNMT